MTGWVLVVPFLLIGIAALIFWIWALVDIVKVPDDSMFRAGDRLIWVLIVVLTQVIGAIIYVAIGRPTPGARGTTPSTATSAPPPPPPGSVP